METVDAGLVCTACRVPLEPAWFEGQSAVTCPACGRRLGGAVFPALGRTAEPAGRIARVLEDGEASCFYHAANRAVRVCEQCGRFLCALCAVEMSGRHLCPQCIHAGLIRSAGTPFENRRLLHGSLALALAVVPLLMWYITFITAPIALYVAVRYWKAPDSLVRGGGRLARVVAIVLALLQIGGWCWGAQALWSALQRGN